MIGGGRPRCSAVGKRVDNVRRDGKIRLAIARHGTRTCTKVAFGLHFPSLRCTSPSWASWRGRGLCRHTPTGNRFASFPTLACKRVFLCSLEFSLVSVSVCGVCMRPAQSSDAIRANTRHSPAQPNAVYVSCTLVDGLSPIHALLSAVAHKAARTTLSLIEKDESLGAHGSGRSVVPANQGCPRLPRGSLKASPAFLVPGAACSPTCVPPPPGTRL